MTPKECIRAFIQETFLVDGFPEDASFLRTGIIDSMGIARLVTFLEERYGFAVADDELVIENLDSLSRVAAFVERKLSRDAA